MISTIISWACLHIYAQNYYLLYLLKINLDIKYCECSMRYCVLFQFYYLLAVSGPAHDVLILIAFLQRPSLTLCIQIDFSFLFRYNKLWIVHCTYLGVSGYKKKYFISCLKIFFILTKSVEPIEMPQLGLHCL